jgi:hypothetical protein
VNTSYTLAEIEALRGHLYHYLRFSQSYWLDDGWTRAMYEPPDELLEDQLRTYMLAGIRPEEMQHRSQEACDRFFAADPKRDDQ